MTAKKKSNLFNLLWVGVILAILLIPDVNGWFKQQFMRLGFHKPNMEKPVAAGEATSNEPSSALQTSNIDSEAGFGKPAVWFYDSQGMETDAANQKGKVVFINFWATWCPPCIAELPSIDKLYQKYKDHPEMVFLIVDVDGKIVHSSEFIQKKKLTLPVHIAKGDIPANWLGNSIPTTVVLAKDGQIAMRHEGMADYGSTEVFEFIQGLLDEK